MNTPALLRCPHCDGKAAYVPRAVNLILQKDPSNPKFGVSVVCGTCSAETGNFVDEESAAKRWNRRHVASPAVAPTTQPVRMTDERIGELACDLFTGEKDGNWGPDTLNAVWVRDIAIPLARAIESEVLGSPKPRSFSDFIRNATPEEKEAVYGKVMERASARQVEALQRAEAVPVATAWMHHGKMVNAFPHPPRTPEDWALHDRDGYWSGKGYSQAPLYAHPPLGEAPKVGVDAAWVEKALNLAHQYAMAREWQGGAHGAYEALRLHLSGAIAAVSGEK